MGRPRHIAVVDDNEDIRELLSRYLAENGFRVTASASAEAFRATLRADPPDLVVLDIMMPGEDGISLCRYLYGRRLVPVIFLTAMGDDVERIVGLEIGADDYLPKPFNPRELLARIKAVLRRGGGDSPADAPGGRESRRPRNIRFEDMTLDVVKHEVIGSDGVAVPLSTAEFRLLTVFLREPGVLLSRDRLLRETADRAADPWDRTIDNQISRLRRKVEPDPKAPSLIRTQWGDGYVFTGKVTSE